MIKVLRQVKTQDIQLIQPWLDEATARLRSEFEPEKISCLVLGLVERQPADQISIYL